MLVDSSLSSEPSLSGYRPWKCKVCPAWNYQDNQQCGVCGANLPERTCPHCNAVFYWGTADICTSCNKDVLDLPDKSMWKCKNCAKLNPPGLEVCYDCYTSRPPEESKTDAPLPRRTELKRSSNDDNDAFKTTKKPRYELGSLGSAADCDVVTSRAASPEKLAEAQEGMGPVDTLSDQENVVP